MHLMQRDADMDNPEQFAAWCWAGGIPDPSPVRPDPIPIIAPQLTAGISQQLWDFGFRHHSDLQTKWIEGGAGLGGCAPIVDEPPKASSFEDLVRQFLAERDPKMLEAILSSPEEEKDRVVKVLGNKFAALAEMLEALGGVDGRDAKRE